MFTISLQTNADIEECKGDVQAGFGIHILWLFPKLILLGQGMN